MLWARSERGARGGARPGWPVVLLAALLGAGVGVTVPRPVQTAAAFVDDATVVAGTFEVRPCSYEWSEAVDLLGPIRHYDFAAEAPAGNVPSPGLLVCDPSGARRLNGWLGESVPDPDGAMGIGEVSSLALWVSITDPASPGGLVWLTQEDDYALGLRMADGLLELVEVPSVGEPVVLAQTTAPTGDPRLVTLTRSSPENVRLWVGTSEVATGQPTLAGNVASTLTLTLGAQPVSGASSASAVLDEVVVLSTTLDTGGVASLVAANSW